MYPAKTKNYLEKREEKRMIAENIKKGASAYKISNVQAHRDQKAIIRATDYNPNDVQGANEILEGRRHEKSDIEKD
jgi:hypothetical protein